MNRQSLSWFFALFFSSSFGILGQTEILAVFTVHSGEYQRINTPVSIDIFNLGIKSASDDLELVEITNGNSKSTPFQIEARKQSFLLWWILDDDTPSGTTREFQLLSKSSGSNNNRVEIIDTKKAIQFNIGEKEVLAYHYALTPVPNGVDEVYRRGGYIHPLWSPAGEVLTRIQPPDHYHHYGIWNPWTHTEFEGREIDFWNLVKRQATVVVEKEPVVENGPVFGNLTAFHEHIVYEDSLRTDSKVALNETWEIRVWNSDASGKVWLVDFISTMSCASESPLTIKEYRYQGFSMRATENWNDNNASLLTSQGKNKSDGNATRARWCDINGVSQVSGTSGILFMTHPDNYNYPEQLRIWPTGANDGKENVFVNFNPAQDRDWKLKPGNSYTLRYRMMIYDGSIDKELAENYWNDFAYSPLISKSD